jgi:predicted PurR-regulated permease PerM
MTSTTGFRWDRLSFRLAASAWVATVILFHSIWSFPSTPIIVAVPVAVAGVPLLVRRGLRATRTAAAVLLMVFVFVGIFSIGLLFLPAAVTMIISATSPLQMTADQRAA